jgi:hypothetical protein
MFLVYTGRTFPSIQIICFLIEVPPGTSKKKPCGKTQGHDETPKLKAPVTKAPWRNL